MLKKLFLLVVFICFVAVAGLLGGIYWLVVEEPGEEIRAENIHRILGKESHVFYSDGVTKLGVFFDTAHRQYVTFDKIPKNFVNAMVASEDNRFFSHFGFDIVGIARAMIKNIQAGRIVQGGSTLTQQTAKNLFKRTERTLEAKLKELLFALRLEYYFPKEKIFEFYANQFYVSGNGHGLGVAARYYFDKTPGELSLIECAFIAGSVKRPNYYNPFIKKTEEASQLARDRGKIRLEYVLDKMQKLGMIDVFTYNETLDMEVEFKKGKVGYDLDYAMELVRDAVSSTEVLDALEEHKVANIATSGVRVITTIDRQLQEKTLAILRGELSRLDVRLRGYERLEVQEELTQLDYNGDSVLKEGAFLFGEIESIEGEGDDVQILVIFKKNDKEFGQGLIDSQGLSKLLAARVKWQGNRNSKIRAGDQAKLVSQLQVGDKVWVSVRELSEEDEPLLAILELEKYPLVQGGALVIQNGAIKSMAGGSENRFFNRAIHARRTMGSAFKPLVYTAALQLGWNSGDKLRNQRDVFVYHNQPYYPRPDHFSPHEWVSMSWAGVRSENVASVWLLSHLCDKLSLAQLSEVANKVGLGPRVIDGDKESYRSYRTRIRDKYGISVNRDMLRNSAYRLAVENLETDFIFDGMIADYERLKSLPYGLNYDNYYQDIKDQLKQKRKKLTKREVGELVFRKSLLTNNYLQLESLRRELRNFQILNQPGGSLHVLAERDSNAYSSLASLYENSFTGQFHFMTRQPEEPELIKIGQAELRGYLDWMDGTERRQFWQSVQLNSLLSVAAFDQVAEQMEFEYKKLTNQLPYSIEVLSQVEDFRISVGLHYLLQFAEQLGIKSSLQPVLSFPLGSNVVTLLEATRMYEGLVTGTVTTFGDSEQEESNDSLAILDRIESAEGDLLYRPEPVAKNLVDDKSRIAISNILENIVKFGTGRRAKQDVKLVEDEEGNGAEIAKLKPVVPLLGKTGTANRYTNASFFGYLPGVAENGVAMTLRDGYAMGVYVGFDNNDPMRRTNSRIAGSAGALPSWGKIANTLMQQQHYSSKLDPVDISFGGLGLKRDELGQINVKVDPEQGGTIVEPVAVVSDIAQSQPSILTFGQKIDGGRFKLERNFQPFWQTASDN